MAAKRKFLEQRLSTLLQEKKPLDEYQQDEVVETMETLLSYHDIFWTRAFAILSLALGLGYFGDAGHQFLYPFQTKHRGLWEVYLTSSALILCEIVFGSCMVFCSAAVFLRSREKSKGFLWFQMNTMTICCSFFSLYMIANAISEGGRTGGNWTRVDLLWLPLLPTTYCLLIYYVVQLLDRSFKDVQKLKQQQYAFKAI